MKHLKKFNEASKPRLITESRQEYHKLLSSGATISDIVNNHRDVLEAGDLQSAVLGFAIKSRPDMSMEDAKLLMSVAGGNGNNDDIDTRLIIKYGRLDILKEYIKEFGKPENTRNWMSNVAMDNNHMDIVDYLIDELGENKEFNSVMMWISGSSDDVTEKKMKLIQSWVDSGRVEIGDKYRDYDKGSTKGVVIITKEEMLKKYGSLLNYVKAHISHRRPVWNDSKV